MVKCILLSAFVMLASCTGRPDVLGLDANKNGIADTVDSYILGVALTDSKSTKLERLALAYQQALSVDLRELKQIKAADEAISSSVSDVFINLTNKNGSRAAASMIQSIENLTLDTEYKRAHYRLLNQYIASLPKEQPSSCQEWAKADDGRHESTGKNKSKKKDLT